MYKFKRVTVYISDEQNTLIRQGRLVEDSEVEAIDRVFKLFNFTFEVDEIPDDTRLYSLSVTTRDRNISDNLLTRKELAEHISPYLGRGKMIPQGEFKKLLNGEISQIFKETQGGEILVGYELTVRGEGRRSILRLPGMPFGRKKEKAAGA